MYRHSRELFTIRDNLAHFERGNQFPFFHRPAQAALAVVYDEDSSAFYGSSRNVYEYLAAGLPVVATPIPDVVRLGDFVSTARSVDEWVQQIERSLHEDSPELRRKRQEFARQHSWDKRAKQAIEIIENAYKEWEIGKK